jgi:hypothetical protein
MTLFRASVIIQKLLPLGIDGHPFTAISSAGGANDIAIAASAQTPPQRQLDLLRPPSNAGVYGSLADSRGFAGRRNLVVD